MYVGMGSFECAGSALRAEPAPLRMTSLRALRTGETRAPTSEAENQADGGFGHVAAASGEEVGDFEIGRRIEQAAVLKA